jgi:CcmD family protein
MSGLGYLALGYALILVIIGGYVVFLGRRQAGLRRQVEMLEMSKSEKRGGSVE